jgi:FSR family fosmidomycin resistance protein-like MFS transporter
MIGIWAVYKTIAGLDLAWAGIIAAVSALIGESLQAWFGPLTDKGYRQKLVLAGIGLTMASALMAYTENYVFLFIFVLFTCIGSGAFHPSAVSVMNELSDKHKALFMTIFQSGGSVGLALSQLLFSQAYFTLDGHTLFLAIPSVFLMVLIMVKGYGAQQQPQEQKTKKSGRATFAAFFRTKEMTCLYLTQLCNQALLWATIFLLPDVLVARGYDEWLSFGGAHLFFILGGAAMMVPAGFLADRYSCRKVILASTFTGAWAFYCFLSAPALSPLALCCLLFVAGASFGTVSPVVIALGNRYVPLQSGAVNAFLMGMVWCIAEGVGMGGGGALTKIFADNAAANALSCLGFLLVVGLTSAWLLPKEEYSLQLELA